MEAINTKLLILIFIIVLPGWTFAQGWLGVSSTQMNGLNQSGSSNPLYIGIGVASQPNITLTTSGRLQFQGLTSYAGSDVLVVDPSTGEVNYTSIPIPITSVNFDCGIGTLTFNGSLSTALKAWILSGSTTTSTDYLGTYNDDDIRICTHNDNCNFQITKQKMIITKDGYVSIASYDGTNNPTPPQNKLIVQNGTIQDPYPIINASTGVTASQLGIVAISNDASGTNVASASVVKQDNATASLGSLADVEGDNTGQKMGFMAILKGNNTANYGNVVQISGDYSDNEGFSVDVEGDSHNTGVDNIGVNVIVGSTSSNTGQNIGYFSKASGSTNKNIGIWGNITGTSNSLSNCTGVYGKIDVTAAGASNYGVEGDLSEITSLNTGTPYYAVYGIAANGGAGSGTSSTLVSTSLTNASYAGYFEGDVFCSNTYYYSDPKLKEKIQDYSGALEQIKKLSVKSYTFKNAEYPTMGLPVGNQVGILSTDLKSVFPNLVKAGVHPGNKKDDQKVEFEAVNYNALIPILIQAVKELNSKTEENPQIVSKIAQQDSTITVQNDRLIELTKQLTDLKNMLNDICTYGCSGLNGNNSASSSQSVTLLQSIPNPTTQTATIGYIINLIYSKAFIRVSDINGLIEGDYPITGQGKGNITFDATKISSGTYLYSLIIDGKVADTKSMVVTKE